MNRSVSGRITALTFAVALSGLGASAQAQVSGLTVAPAGPTTPDAQPATLERLQGGTWMTAASTLLDASGNFGFQGLTPGAYRVSAAGPQGACYVGTQGAPLTVNGRAGGTVSATCAPLPTSTLLAAVITVQIGPGAITGSCPACGKSATSSKNNAR